MAVEGYMERKHNKNLTSLARELRKNMTPEERHLWYDYLRNYPVKFLRQKVIDDYIVDFYCHEAKLIIEIDGKYHKDDAVYEKDMIRTEILESRNLKVLRIPNKEIHQNFKKVCEQIDTYVEISLRHPTDDTSL